MVANTPFREVPDQESAGPCNLGWGEDWKAGVEMWVVGIAQGAGAKRAGGRLGILPEPSKERPEVCPLLAVQYQAAGQAELPW